MAHQKIQKQAVLYLHKPDTDYECQDCSMWISETNRCTIHGPNDIVNANGSCGLFVKGAAMPGKPMSEVTKQDSGYVETKNGFSCKRCQYFEPDAWNCQVVDRFSAGPEYGIIHPDACCNNWEPLKQT